MRRGCARVARDPDYVRIVEGTIQSYAATLAVQDLSPPQLDPASHYVDDAEGTLAFIVTLDTINFGSGYFPHLRKREGMSGYFTLATSLTEHFRARGPWNAQELLSLRPGDCAALFGQSMDIPQTAELMGLFSRALNELGRFLIQQHRGSFYNLVQSAAGSAARLVADLISMPLFNDATMYRDFKVPFYKRAQLMAADLALAFHGSGPGSFRDLDRLTIFADNLVPHVLRCDGVLEYSPSLARQIDEQHPIPAGSLQEVEIRACAVHAVELLSERLRKQGCTASPMQIDYLLWNRGQQKKYKELPRHRTRTPYY